MTCRWINKDVLNKGKLSWLSLVVTFLFTEMGQVEAKEAFPSSRPEETIPLDSIQAKVVSVSVDGLNRTKNDVVMDTVKDLFSVGDFEELVLKSQQVRGKLQDLGCFSNVGIHIDTSKTGDQDYSVTFEVRIWWDETELNRI